MKMKSFAMLVLSGLLATSITYIAPAMADDMNNTMQPSTDNSSTQNSAAPAPSDNANIGTTTPSGDNMNGMSGGSTSPNDNTNNSGSDQGSPDTATGDDDY